ncbi:hypothetical protein PISMIDRAFT_11983 [Pisolithus microcarpus 441]|uniref:Uncharacterized protein n=1 Tax=Pisolithus microcarpus 441 TaxID=765257 RepID=A0A0C9YYI1_9AGAM|nr:hypothetical protein BKA83DRAFT_11983 [Pisolithus microcarpus]KIK21831.1 hypothetical protein PISMIDRAFT_11983 [Pisolithus microcarpus 441]
MSSFKYVSNAARTLQEGYVKYRGTQFKISTLNRWIVFIGHQHLEDIKESTGDELSLIEAAKDQQSAEVDSRIGPEINTNRYHISVARTHLTLKLGLYYPDIKHTDFGELLDLKDNGAVDELLSFTIDADAADSVEERSSSGNHTGHRTRIQQHLGSSSSCRLVWIDLNFRLVTTDAKVFDTFPEFLPCVDNTAAGIACALKHLDPIVKECFRCVGGHEVDWSDKPASRSFR